MCDDPRVRLVSFTGSTAVGRKLLVQCAPSIKRTALELGGNAPFVVFEDADLDVAARALAASKLRNAGQACVATNRVLVHESVRVRLIEKLLPLLAAERLGHGLDEGVTMGPLIRAQAAAKFWAHLDDALAKGATLRYGGAADERLRPLLESGSETEGAPFCPPTIIDGVNSKMALWTEETFGPLFAITTFGDEAEALALANDSSSGLAGYFCTQSIQRLWRFGEALEVGMVGVNEGIISTEVAPFGGVKESGLGREGGNVGIDEFLETKYICVGNVR
jgi:succinate-semialdehyde dehydrogenase/glutarate-semialdehyde dehydrogenase